MEFQVHASMGWITLLLPAMAVITSGQIPQTQNVLSDTIPINLRDCYNSSYITTRENFLPMTKTNLIALLRKLEDATYNMNSRTLAPAVLLKYRYDGIERRPDVQTSQYVKPYARTGKEYYLYKFQMNKIIQPTTGTSNIPDNTLTFDESCTLHAMLSLSIDKYDRGDGDVPCSKLSKYSEWNARYPRDLSKTGDAEFLWPSYDALYSGDYQSGVNYGAGTFQAALSQCPMEYGVVYDKYGSLAPGIVLAGVAAGLNYQTVPYSSYFVHPRNTGERRKVQSAADHYRNLFSINSWQQQSSGTRNGGTYGRPESHGNGYNPQQPGSSGYNPHGVNYDYGGSYGQNNPSYGQNNPSYGQNNPSYGQNNPSYGQGNGYPSNSGYGSASQGGYQPSSGNVPSSQGGYRPSVGSSGYGSNGASGYGNAGGSYGNPGSYGNSGSSYGASGYNPSNADIDGRYAATLAGSVALEGLLQGPEQSISVGSQGGWNSSSLPKYYFLQSWVTGNMLTDARITGGVDGLYLANNIQTWKSAAGGSDIKLSQILDSYYSSRGVLNSNVKACNRKTNFNQFSSQLSQQSFAVAYMLNNDFPPGALLSDVGVQSFAEYTAKATADYVASLPGTQCPYNSSAPFSRPYANLTVVVDCNWSFRHVAGILNYLAENCDFWRYGSTLTIINGKDGSILRESIQSPLDIPRDYNDTAMGGFDFPKVLAALRVRFLNNLQNEGTKQSAGGLPHIVIFVPMSTTMSDNDKSRAQDTINSFRFNIPDVRFLYVVTGSKDVWAPFAYDKDKDIFVSPQGSDLDISLQPLMARIETIPRRIINPNCGKYFEGSSYNPVSLDGYLSPNEIHYYRVHQNYFFRDTSATITITSKSVNPPTLMICQSRKIHLPMRNVSGSGNVNCQQLTGANSYQLPTISGECSGDYYAASCDAYYFSIYNTQTGSTLNSGSVSCNDDQCRFLDQAKYTITHQGLTCYSSASSTFASIFLVAIIGVLNFMRF